MYSLREILYLKKYYDWFPKIAFITLLLKIRDDIFRATSKGEHTLPIHSDYSKAFDTVQHHTTIQKLHKIGCSTSALKWFISYLGNRSQYIQVNDATKPCHSGVPLGSVLGPLLFNLYINDLQDIDPADLVNTCQYADDTKQYTSTSKSHRFNKLPKTLKSVWII